MSQIQGSAAARQGVGRKPDSDGSSGTGSGKVYFHIFNGRKYCVAQGDGTITLEKVNDDPTPNTKAMWQMIRDDNGSYTFKNRYNGNNIVLDDTIKTESATGDISKWKIEPVMNLAIDECRIVKVGDEDPKQVLANSSGSLITEDKKSSGDITQQADQLFRIVYAGDAK